MKSTGVGKNGQITATTTAQMIPLNLVPRETVSLTNLGTVNIYVGFDASTTTTSLGYPVLPNGGSIGIDGSMSVYVIAASGTADVRWIAAG